MSNQGQERFCKFIVERLTDAVYWIRRDGTFAYVNPAACQMLGYTEEELLRKSMFDIHPTMDADKWSTMWQALMEQGRRAFQSVHRTSQGETLTVDLITHRRDRNGG